MAVRVAGKQRVGGSSGDQTLPPTPMPPSRRLRLAFHSPTPSKLDESSANLTGFCTNTAEKLLGKPGKWPQNERILGDPSK